MAKSELARLREENATLRRLAATLQFYARRYADGRASYAPTEVNEITRTLLALGVKLETGKEGVVWCRGASNHTGLTEDHHTPGHPVATGYYLGLPEQTSLADELVRLAETNDLLEMVRRIGEWKAAAEKRRRGASRTIQK